MYVEYTAQTGNAGFLGIEVKYHEHFGGVAPEHRERYLEIARDMECFRPDAYPGLLCQLEQVWRDRNDARRRGERGAATVATYSWARTAEQMRRIIRRFAN